MTEDMVKSYLETLRLDVQEIATEFTDQDSPDPAPVAFAQEAFSRAVVDTLQSLGHISGGELCHFEQRVGRGQGRVMGYHSEVDVGRLNLFTTIWHGMPVEAQRVPKSDIIKAIRQAVAVFTAAQQGWHKQMEPASIAFDMMHHLHEIAPQIQRIRIIVMIDGLAAPIDEWPDDLSQLEVTADLWDLQRLARANASGLHYEPIEIDFVELMGAPLPCLKVPVPESDYGACLTAFPGTLLSALYHEYGSRLLELNVRSFLQAKGKVNRGIRDTLRNEPSMFLAYNNGISATAEDLEYVELPSGGLGIRKLRGLQVVNGGQTLASIHRARHHDKAPLVGVFVQAKITIVAAGLVENLVPLVSRYANTQNKVSEADFSANHPFHVKLQQVSEKTWTPGEQTRWFYERARGQYQVARAREGSTPARQRQFDSRTPKKQVIDKVDLARYLNSWDQYPHAVGKGGQGNFVHFMDRLARQQGKDWEPDSDYFKRAIACALIYKETERKARKLKLAYRANAIAYTASLLSYRTAGRVDLMAIWNDQRVSPALAATVEEWLPAVHDAIIEGAAGRNVTEWAKREDCWRRIQTEPVAVSVTLEDELSRGQPLPTVGDAGGRKGDNLSQEDRENLARVMQVSAAEWLHLSGWGHKSGHLQDWQSGVAATLASYAAQDWTKVPSAKQASHGMRILRTAENLGGRLVTDDDS